MYIYKVFILDRETGKWELFDSFDNGIFADDCYNALAKTCIVKMVCEGKEIKTNR